MFWPREEMKSKFISWTILMWIIATKVIIISAFGHFNNKKGNCYYYGW